MPELNVNVNELQRVTSVNEDTSFMVFANINDNKGSVMKVGDFKEQIVQPGVGRYGHNIYRGRKIGTSFTAAQSNHIKDGSFEDLYVGDYWVINGKNWRIAAIDPAYNCGDTNLTTHHVLIVPDANLYNHKMNETNTTEGGYASCYGRTTGLVQATTQFVEAFGDEHILTYRDYLSNAVTNGQASAAAWADCRVELMNEIMVYGSLIKGLTQFDVGIFCFQLPLFKQCPEFIHKKQYSWLRSVASGAHFATVGTGGTADANNASNAHGIRPFALLS